MPPVVHDVSIVNLTRGTTDPTDSCEDFGWIHLNVEAEDDDTPQSQLRYRLQDMSEEEEFFFDEPVPWLQIVWLDDGTEDLRLDLRVFALDESGNQSEPFELKIVDEGAGGAHCSVSLSTREPDASWSLLSFTLLASALVAGRRRSRRVGQ